MNPYEMALQVQDASNLSGVCLGLARLVEALNKRRPANEGSDWLRTQPALLLYLDKICDMVGRPWEGPDAMTLFASWYDQCQLGADVVRLQLEKGTHECSLCHAQRGERPQSTYCGSMCSACLAEHVKVCGVCAEEVRS